MYWAYSLLVENISFMCPRICIDHILQLKMFSVLVFSIFIILRYFHYISWAYFAHDRPLAGGSEANICQACQSITLLLAPLTFFPIFQIFVKYLSFWNICQSCQSITHLTLIPMFQIFFLLQILPLFKYMLTLLFHHYSTNSFEIFQIFPFS